MLQPDLDAGGRGEQKEHRPSDALVGVKLIVLKSKFARRYCG